MIPRVRPAGQVVRYPVPWRVAGGLLWAALLLRQRSFARDARAAVSYLQPPIEVVGDEHIPVSEPCIVVCNHYSRPGFQAWWIALGITAAIANRRAPGAEDISWVMTAAWRFEGARLRQRYLTPLSRRFFARVAEVYCFVTVPPMPPAPEEMADRAVAVLRTVRLAHQLARTGGVLGLAPEGRDAAFGLAEPPPGVGTFVALLVGAGLIVLPAAISEFDGRLHVSFGPPFVPAIPASRAERDEKVATQVMAAIARLLP